MNRNTNTVETASKGEKQEKSTIAINIKDPVHKTEANGEVETASKDENKEKPIIAFCTDIKDSVHGIQVDGETAFQQYYHYIENVADFYTKQLTPKKAPDKALDDKSKKEAVDKVSDDASNQISSEASREVSGEAKFFQCSLWVPGDALWGLANSINGESLKDDIIIIFSRIISAIAYGLAKTNKWAKEQGIENVMNMRAAGFYGQIFGKELSNDHYLFNGRCLNACGRMQGHANLNSMIIGFIFNQNDDSEKEAVNKFFNIELPEIEFDKIEAHIRQMLSYGNQSDKYGCSIKFHTVKTLENKLLLHFATYPTQKLKGLEDTMIITTKVEFQVLESHEMFRIGYDEHGLCYRKEYVIKPFTKIDLSELITDDKLNYLQKIYPKENNIILKFDEKNRNFILQFEGDEHYPRVFNGTKGWVAEEVIDFTIYKYCILPAHNAFNNISRNKAILVFTKNTDNDTAITFTEIPGTKVNSIVSYESNYYFDSSDLCIKYRVTQ